MNITNADIKQLKDKKYRRENKLFMVEGNKFCYDLLSGDIEIVMTLTSDKNLKGFPNTEYVSEKMLSSLATTITNQNIICVCKVKDHGIKSVGNSIILDNIQDPGNVGTLVRSAMAFGFNDIYLVEGVDPYSEKVIRSSAGLIMSARLHVCSFEEIEKNKNEIADVFMVADMGGENINSIKQSKNKVAVIVGNEGQGVSNRFLELSNKTVSIPMMPQVESLNVGVAGSIIMQKLSELN